jgi:hypothetical protein
MDRRIGVATIDDSVRGNDDDAAVDDLGNRDAAGKCSQEGNRFVMKRARRLVNGLKLSLERNHGRAPAQILRRRLALVVKATLPKNHVRHIGRRDRFLHQSNVGLDARSQKFPGVQALCRRSPSMIHVPRGNTHRPPQNISSALASKT